MNKNHEGDFSMTADRRRSEGARCQPPAQQLFGGLL